VAILLVSADFLGSDFILRKEVPDILVRRNTEGLVAVPVIVKSCLWERITWLSSMQVRPLYGKPLAAHRGNQRDTQLAAIAAEVIGCVESDDRSNGQAFSESSSHSSYPAARSQLSDLQIAPLEANVDALLDGAPLISTLEGFVLNSGRFLERYLELQRLYGVHLGHVRFIVPSSGAIQAAYRTKPKSQERYLSETVKHIETAWQHLESQQLIEKVEFRRINCVPRNLCVIRNHDLVLTGLYELDHNHPLGLTCHKSWLHDKSSDPKGLCQTYSDWFNVLWEESFPAS